MTKGLEFFYVTGKVTFSINFENIKWVSTFCGIFYFPLSLHKKKLAHYIVDNFNLYIAIFHLALFGKANSERPTKQRKRVDL